MFLCPNGDMNHEELNYARIWLPETEWCFASESPAAVRLRGCLKLEKAIGELRLSVD